jgi:transposase-like protein
VAGNWAYLYRAVDSAGDTIEFMLSPKRDLIAAKLFLRLALSGGSPGPRVINVDGHPAYASAIAELKQSAIVFRLWNSEFLSCSMIRRRTRSVIRSAGAFSIASSRPPSTLPCFSLLVIPKIDVAGYSET